MMVSSPHLRAYNVEADQHPCALVEQYFGPRADGSIIGVVNRWLTGNGGTEANPGY